MSQSKLSGLRIVTFNVLPPAYQLISRWAAQTDNKIALVVTTPGPSTRPTPSFREVVAAAASNRHEVLVTTRIRHSAAPLIRELKPDLIFSFSFPYLLPPEILSLSRIPAVNLHPTPLPYYRGPNPLRLFYDGFPTMGATLHYTAAEFDTGAVLSQHTAPLPQPFTAEALLSVWPMLMMQTLAEGIARAVAGAPGTPQDDAKASYAAQFTEEDKWLNWTEPAAVLQRKTTALNLVGQPEAKAHIGGQAYLVQKVEPLAVEKRAGEAGAILERNDDALLIATGDGAARVTATPIGA